MTLDNFIDETILFGKKRLCGDSQCFSTKSNYKIPLSPTHIGGAEIINSLQYAKRTFKI